MSKNCRGFLKFCLQSDIMAKILTDGANMYDDKKYMKRALALAAAAARDGEAPVGCVIVSDGQIVASGRNMREKKKNALLHAEIIAINRACRRLGRWRLSGCTVYVTLEPCPMCAGALINCRADRVVYGCSDPKAGSFGSIVNLNELGYNHRCEVTGGILAEECALALSNFFKALRKRNRDDPAGQNILSTNN